MKKQYFNKFLLCLFFTFSQLYGYKVGFLIVATGGYTVFVDPLIKSARENFLKNHDVTYFVFTDGEISSSKDIVKLFHRRVGWPYDTLVRHYASYNYRDILSKMDYLFYCDADTVFDGSIGDEILGDLVGAQALSHVNSPHAYDIQEYSVAFVPKKDRKEYCSGSFYGGRADLYLDMMQKIVTDIEKDWQEGFFATHHDESYLNHYLAYSKHTIISPYCVVDCNILPEKPRKILQVNKDNFTIRKAEKWRSDNKNSQWWLDCFDNCAEEMLFSFGNVTSASRVFLRERILNEGYSTVLDVGCGYYMDYFGFRNSSKVSVHYKGIDIVPYFVALAKTMGVDVDHANAENLPYEKDTFDIVYARNLLEHVSDQKKVISEMIRCAKKEIAVTVSRQSKAYGKEKLIPPYFSLEKDIFVKYVQECAVEYGKDAIVLLQKDLGDEVVFLVKFLKEMV